LLYLLYWQSCFSCISVSQHVLHSLKPLIYPWENTGNQTLQVKITILYMIKRSVLNSRQK